MGYETIKQSSFFIFQILCYKTGWQSHIFYKDHQFRHKITVLVVIDFQCSFSLFILHWQKCLFYVLGTKTLLTKTCDIKTPKNQIQIYWPLAWLLNISYFIVLCSSYTHTVWASQVQYIKRSVSSEKRILKGLALVCLTCINHICLSPIPLRNIRVFRSRLEYSYMFDSEQNI